METPVTQKSKVLYLIACAAPPAARISKLVTLAQSASWDVCVISTPYATRFIDKSELEQQTGHVVRCDYKLPTETDILPPADAILVMPATFNTINKWALGLGDNLATSILCEAIGRSIPITAVPYLNDELRKHPAFSRNIALLREHGVQVILKSDLPQEGAWEYVFERFEDMQDKNLKTINTQTGKFYLAKVTIRAFIDGFTRRKSST